MGFVFNDIAGVSGRQVTYRPDNPLMSCGDFNDATPVSLKYTFIFDIPETVYPSSFDFKSGVTLGWDFGNLENAVRFLKEVMYSESDSSVYSLIRLYDYDSIVETNPLISSISHLDISEATETPITNRNILRSQGIILKD